MTHKIAFLYGLGEGPWHGKQFTRRLQSTHVEVVTDPTAADIVIAHSAGSFYVPQLRDDQTVMFINPPYWPGRDPYQQMRQKIVADFRLNFGKHPLYLLRKTVWNVIYIIGHLARTKEIIRIGKTFDLPATIQHHRTIVVRNDADTWLTPDLESLQKIRPTIKIHRLPGEHDDCWLHPEAYVNLLQSDI